MELHLGSLRWTARMPDWAAAAVAGFGAGGVLMLVELIWSSLVIGDNPWGTSRMVAAIVMGTDVLGSSEYSTPVLAVALCIHFALGVVLGLILSIILVPFHLDESTPLALAVGAAYGLVIYLFNFYGMAALYPWFSDLRGVETVAAHMVFGMTAAFTFIKLARPQASAE